MRRSPAPTPTRGLRAGGLRLAELEVPLEDVAAEPAAETGDRVRQALRGLPGVATFTVRARAGRVRVTYDPALVAPDAIRARLAAAGLMAPGAAAGGR